jgi:glycerol-3-phosphate dehydrogenase (NAD(P)+)
MKITILGNGVYGKAMTNHLSRKGHSVRIDDIGDSEIIFVCIPSYAVIPVLSKLKDQIKDQQIIICSKGFASDEQLLSEALKEKFKNKIFFLYGPSLAPELEKGELTGMVLAGGEGKEELKKEIESETLKIELSEDIIGVQIGATLKNALTIFVGILEGAGYGQNAQAFILTKGIAEIQKIGIALGANPNTFLGLTCVGDLMLRSRNRLIGIELGKGRKLDEVVEEINIEHIPEGITAIKNARAIAQKNNIETPLINSLYSIIFENLSIEQILKEIK